MGRGWFCGVSVCCVWFGCINHEEVVWVVTVWLVSMNVCLFAFTRAGHNELLDL